VTRLLLRVWKTNHHVIFLLGRIPNPCLTLPIFPVSRPHVVPKARQNVVSGHSMPMVPDFDLRSARPRQGLIRQQLFASADRNPIEPLTSHQGL